MRQISLIRLYVSIIISLFTKKVRVEAHVQDAMQHFNSSNIYNISVESTNLFSEKEIQEGVKKLKKKFGEIDVELLVKGVDKKKVTHFLEDQEDNLFLHQMMFYTSYKSLCLGEMSSPADIQSKLKCRYNDRGNPSLKIAPFKEEEANLEPRIVLIHDVVYDHEIETIKKLAQPKLEKASFLNYTTGEDEVKDYRITETAWIDRTDHEHVEAVNFRVEQMTGLRLDTAEALQVAYYPLNGKYEPHFDFESDYPQDSYETDDRIATVLLYLNHVEKGGNTVFPMLDVALRPKKGSAAFWYNLKPNGYRDYLTLHAACPVTEATKWAANLWISETWQEFHRPCTLENQVRDKEWEDLLVDPERYKFQNST